MKKCINWLLIIFIFFFICTNFAFARAGGGNSGTGSSASSGNSVHSTSHISGPKNVIERVITDGFFIIFLFYSSILLKIKLSKLKRTNKLKMKKIRKQDITWNYKNLEKIVIESYFIIQEAWKNNDFSKASHFMMPDLVEQFQIKLNWLEVQNRKNIMDKIELLSAFPISFHDDIEDEKDYIWYYIKGKMVDYIIDTETEKVVSGCKYKKVFIEYWQFKKNKENKWVLNKIMQEDEQDKLPI